MEVAALLGVDAATLRQRLARARARLLAELERLPAAGVRRRTTSP
jgi:DNA-directed RNA polymerase specialized sigma24 family protein